MNEAQEKLLPGKLGVSPILNSLESLFDKEGLREFGDQGVEDGAAERCRESEGVRRGV